MKTVIVTICVIVMLVPLPAGAQLPSWEKEGRFIAPDQGLSLGRTHMDIHRHDGPHPFDVLHYALDLHAPLTSDALAGVNIITLRLKEPSDSLELHAVGLAMDSVLVNGVTKSIGWNNAAETFTIHLGEVIPSGETLTVHIGYHRIPGYPRPNSRQGYYFFDQSIGIPSNLGYTFSEPSDARFWVPCYDEPWDKATMAIALTVPDAYVAASNGRLVSVTPNGDGTTTWRWMEHHRIATYLMCMTISGFTISEIPFVRAPGDTIPLQYYAWPADSSDVAAYLPEVNAMMQFFSHAFGPYPFDKYGMTAIVPFSYLGMEHQTLTTMNRFARTRTRVVSHELAHQWWGDLVTCGTWPDIWLNESFATYSEALWREHVGGPAALKNYMRDTLQRFNLASWQGAIYNPVGQGFNLFDDVVYGKGAWVLHTLRGVVGDSTFFAILRAYRERYGLQSAVTAELEVVVDSVAGQDMSWFFNQWVYSPGWPRYSYEVQWWGDTADVDIGQFQPSNYPTYSMPIRLLLRYGNRPDTTVIVWNNQRVQSYRIPLAGDLLGIEFDPDGWILKEVFPWPLSVADDTPPASFRLRQNYPNPFNPTTTLTFSIQTSSFVTLKVYDVLGREVATLLNERKESGTHQVEFNAQGLPSGVYFARLSSPAGTAMIRMVSIK